MSLASPKRWTLGRLQGDRGVPTHALRAHGHLVNVAKAMVKALEGDYDAAHLRTGDTFEALYPEEARTSRDRIEEVVASARRARRPLFLMAREAPPGWRVATGASLGVGDYRWLSLAEKGVVEQLVAANARHFYGTGKSSMTEHVLRLRATRPPWSVLAKAARAPDPAAACDTSWCVEARATGGDRFKDVPCRAHQPPRCSFWSGVKVGGEDLAQDPPPRSCKLAIVAAGVARAGSGEQVRLIEEALALLGVEPKRFYWNWHWLASDGDLEAGGGGGGDDARARAAAASRERLASATAGDVLLIKSHEFDPNLAGRACRRRLVFTTHRRPTALAASLLGGGATLGGLGLELRMAINHHTCWLRRAPHVEDTAYEELKADASGALRRYGRKLAAALGEEPEAFDALADAARVPSEGPRSGGDGPPRGRKRRKDGDGRVPLLTVHCATGPWRIRYNATVDDEGPDDGA
jgi:hypothetical protein